MIIEYSLIVFNHKRYYTSDMEVLFAKQRDTDTKFKFAGASLLYPTILSYKIAGKIMTGPKEIAAKWPKPKRASPFEIAISFVEKLFVFYHHNTYACFPKH